ncbi:MAG: hypothetical protein COA94_00230 [Rickettsiales bacterium]|nr:MAG: hypothetical protein COA94_00230 [Rickettsiales bacterium]
MIQISCYLTELEALPKVFCGLAEKCYYSDMRTLVLTENDSFSTSLDRVLWTYSKKHFIPHAMSGDPQPEDQPILITSAFEHSNNAEIVIFVNATESMILEAAAAGSAVRLQNMKKILFLFDDAQKMQSSEINNILKKSSLGEFELKSFAKTSQGTWKTI